MSTWGSQQCREHQVPPEPALYLFTVSLDSCQCKKINFETFIRPMHVWNDGKVLTRQQTTKPFQPWTARRHYSRVCLQTDWDVFMTAKKNQFSIASLFFSYIDPCSESECQSLSPDCSCNSRHLLIWCSWLLCQHVRSFQKRPIPSWSLVWKKKLKYAYLHSKIVQRHKLVLLKMLQVFHI